MTIKKMLKLTPSDVLSLRERASAGDSGAALEYTQYSAWKRIDSVKGYSKKAKLELYNELTKGLTIQWQAKPSS